jgi:hypothetical protein
MKISKLGTAMALMSASGLAAVACGDDDINEGHAAAGGGGESAAGSGAGGSSAMGGAGHAGAPGAGEAGRGGDPQVGGGGNDSMAGSRNDGGTGCNYEDESYEIGERFIDELGHSEAQLCTCQGSGDVTCQESDDACSVLENEHDTLFQQASSCDPKQAVDPCTELVSDGDFFCGACGTFVTPEGATLLEGTQPLQTLYDQLSCDQPLPPCPTCREPSAGRCSEQGICESSWLGVNLLDNGDFEYGGGGAGRPLQWEYEPSEAFSGSLEVHDGTGALQVAIASPAADHGFRQSFAYRGMRTGGQMRVRGYYRIDRLDTSATFVLRIRGKTDVDHALAAPASAGQWLPFDEQIRFDFDHRATFEVLVRTASAGETNVLFDDLTLEQVTES